MSNTGRSRTGLFSPFAPLPPSLPSLLPSYPPTLLPSCICVSIAPSCFQLIGPISRPSSGFAFRTAVTLGLGLGAVALFSVFASPRQIAQHQIENDKVIGGGPTSNTGKALADLKRRDGVKTSHQLHQEQSGSTILGTK
jgi:hypothetical protein